MALFAFSCKDRTWKIFNIKPWTRTCWIQRALWPMGRGLHCRNNTCGTHYGHTPSCISTRNFSHWCISASDIHRTSSARAILSSFPALSPQSTAITWCCSFSFNSSSIHVVPHNNSKQERGSWGTWWMSFRDVVCVNEDLVITNRCSQCLKASTRSGMLKGQPTIWTKVLRRKVKKD